MAKELSEKPTTAGITRRQLLAAGGTTLVAATLPDSLFRLTALGQDMPNMKGIVSKNGGMKPTILPAPDSNDPAAFSVAENIFWNEQLMEHAKFSSCSCPFRN